MQLFATMTIPGRNLLKTGMGLLILRQVKAIDWNLQVKKDGSMISKPIGIFRYSNIAAREVHIQ